MTARLALVLGDQLTHNLSSIQKLRPGVDTILMAEVREEATYVRHHKKKIALIFSAMRHFAYELAQRGFRVCYRKYDDESNRGSLKEEVANLIAKESLSEVLITEPGEYRLLQDLQKWEEQLAVPVSLLPDDRFLATKQQFADWASGKKQLRMEFFYREMRRHHQILVENMPSGKQEPVGGKWNYDSQNRNKLPDNLVVPDVHAFETDEITSEVLELVQEHFGEHFGDLEPFHFAVTREQALQVLESFIANRLPLFGDYQDAMKQGEDWLFHSHISFYLNIGLLSPLEAIKAAEQSYYYNQAPLNAVEGFIRQILGWREYVRGLYWYLMPDYKQRNYLEANRPLPDFFWSAETKMNCLSECVRTTKQNAYAHHIQRLMVLGNFALLAGLNPDEVNEWYLLVYADAFEWVELPNVTGMILFADGGVLASKPYAASGSYINKMSDYCKHCQYKVKNKLGEDACPFNYLYWNFLIKHETLFRNNPRMAMIYRTLEKKTPEEVEEIQKQSDRFLISL